ncbi:UrcA family protein [Novosphingobium sp. ZN18A2]|uniref:UrcA family protein n=1 Tax=Novosphingobium sp. ZN18A2 TaxID=3079861 RepID=UPI0030CD2F98
MNRKTILAAGLIGLAFASQPAFAKSVKVPYHDLDLSTPQGQQALDRRVRSAARSVCDVSSRRVSLNEWVAARDCYQDAVSSARKAYADIIPARRPA